MSEKSCLATRAFSVESSIRTRMLELAPRMGDVIALGRGDPDLHSPTPIVEAGVAALEQRLHHYTAPAGMLELREAIRRKLKRDNGLRYTPEQVIVCNGCQEAIFIAIMALVDLGDEVLLQAPRFDAFDHMVNLAGGSVVSVPTSEEDDYALQASSVRAAITDNTKLLVVANPNNPTGSLTERDELLKIAELAVEHDLIVISDEIYEKIVFDDREHCSLASLPGLYDRTITVNGFSKAYAMTGWRVGYLAAPEWFLEPAIEIKHTVSICTSAVMQSGALAALRQGESAVTEMVRRYQQRRDLIMQGLDRIGISYGYPSVALYVYANVSSSGLDAEEFCYQLLRQQQVMIFPGTMFADPANRHVRITLLSPQETIKEALRRIDRFAESL